jgi:hypothetical protein
MSDRIHLAQMSLMREHTADWKFLIFQMTCKLPLIRVSYLLSDKRGIIYLPNLKFLGKFHSVPQNYNGTAEIIFFFFSNYGEKNL